MSRSDLFGHVVINLFDLFLLSRLECFSFTWRGRSMQRRLHFLGLWPCLRARPIRPGLPLGRLSILVWAQSMLTHGGSSGRPAPDAGGLAERDGKILCESELRCLCREATNEWMDCLSSICHFSSQTFLHGEAFTRHSSPEG